MLTDRSVKNIIFLAAFRLWTFFTLKCSNFIKIKSLKNILQLCTVLLKVLKYFSTFIHFYSLLFYIFTFFILYIHFYEEKICISYIFKKIPCLEWPSETFFTVFISTLSYFISFCFWNAILSAFCNLYSNYLTFEKNYYYSIHFVNFFKQLFFVGNKK